jgi:hypothetical protein
LKRIPLLTALALIALRLCHVQILWEGDTLPLAAAGQMLNGRTLYRDIWFDKPPLTVLFHLLPGGQAGAALRLFGALYVLAACWLAYRFARKLWSEREGLWAAGLLAFFLTFDFPSSVIPLASDLLMLAPHLAAVGMAVERRPFWSGVLAGVAFWVNPKGLLVAAACVLWYPAGAAWMAAGFAAVSAGASAWLLGAGALSAWWEQVWQWGRLYAGSPFVESPWKNGLLRTLNWTGFHIAAVAAAALALRTLKTRQWAGWLLLAAGGVALGLRFFPRYYFLLLPVVILLAARGITMQPKLALLLVIPLVRFAPSYWAAAYQPDWRDIQMDRDSRTAAATVNRLSKPGDTLFIWGYRPEIYTYTGLPAATKYLDSQPLTGVPADRHLTQSEPVEIEAPRLRRLELAHSQPTFILDGLGLYNPHLSIGAYPELHNWMADYREVARAGLTVIYRRQPLLAQPAGRSLSEKR